MNKRLVLFGILLLVGLMLSGCVWYEGYGYGYSYGYLHGYGYYNYDYGYPYRHQHQDWDHRHPGSHHWR